MEYKVELPEEIAGIYQTTADYLHDNIENILQKALINYIGTCLN